MTSPVIVRAEAIPVSLPLARPQLMGGGQRFTHSQSLVVRLETDSGLVGWGEASAAPTMTGETLPGMKLVADRVLLPVLERAPVLQRATFERRLERAISGNTASKCAVNVALYDLLGRFRHEFRALDRRGIDGDLVGPGQ